MLAEPLSISNYKLFLVMSVQIPFSPDCICGRFISREKRFTVYIYYCGRKIAVHSNNTGSMLGLLRPGTPVLASPSAKAGRKLAWTQEAIWNGPASPLLKNIERPNASFYNDGFWVGVNTSLPNKLLKVAFNAGRLPFTEGYSKCEQERKYGNSRMDALISGDSKKQIWVECKNVTLVEDSIALFPDAVSERACKHLDDLMSLVANNHRAALFCLVQRPDAKCFGPADIIDKKFSKLFWKAIACGVEVWPFQAHVSKNGVTLGNLLPLAKCTV